jgi:NADH-quinone oxidoreductase subunit E
MLTDEMKRKIEAEIETCPNRRCACIDAMQVVQSSRGWISDDSLKDIADFLEMTVDELDSVATFYNHIYRKPVGRHIILICNSVSCWIMGFGSILDYFTQHLGIEMGETTPDGRFTLLPVECLGACDRAPAIMIDGELFWDLDRKKIETLLENYK